MARRLRCIRGHLDQENATARRSSGSTGGASFEYAAAPPGAEYASVPPCYFPASHLLEVPVLAVHQETRASKVITLGLPRGVSLNLPVSACIMLVAKPQPVAVAGGRSAGGGGATANGSCSGAESSANGVGGKGGEDVAWPMKPYNPISANATTGSFQLLVKMRDAGHDGGDR